MKALYLKQVVARRRRRWSKKLCVHQQRSNIGKNVRPEQEQPPSDVATLPAIVPEDISSQATRRGTAIRSSGAKARRARRASPYDVEDMRLHLADTSIDASTVSFPWIKVRLQSPRISSMDSAKSVKNQQCHIHLWDDVQQMMILRRDPGKYSRTSLRTRLCRKVQIRRKPFDEGRGDRYPKAGKVFASEGKLLDVDTHGISQETKRNPPNSTSKVELSSASRTAFAADPVEMLNTADCLDKPAADRPIELRVHICERCTRNLAAIFVSSP